MPKNPRLHARQKTPKKRVRRPRAKQMTYDRRPHDEVAEAVGCYRVLALDVSSKAVGWSVFENGGLVDWGTYYQDGADHGERLGWFKRWLDQTLADVKPTHVCYEAPYPGRERSAYGILQMYIAQVLAAHFEFFGYEVPEDNRVSAKEVKRLNEFPTGQTHAANKRMAVERVNAWYGLELRYASEHLKTLSDDDTADAVLLNRAWHRRRHPELLETADVR